MRLLLRVLLLGSTCFRFSARLSGILLLLSVTKNSSLTEIGLAGIGSAERAVGISFFTLVSRRYHIPVDRFAKLDYSTTIRVQKSRGKFSEGFRGRFRRCQSFRVETRALKKASGGVVSCVAYGLYLVAAVRCSGSKVL